MTLARAAVRAASCRCRDGAAEIDGLTLVPDVNERFELGIDEDTYTTVGGYVLGRIWAAARASATRSRSPDGR